jgi:hypothetical protein
MVMLINAQHRKAVPGRTTDLKENEWMADVLRQGLLKASVIPPQPIRVLRERARSRHALVHARAPDVGDG